MKRLTTPAQPGGSPNASHVGAGAVCAQLGRHVDGPGAGAAIRHSHL